MRKTVCVMMMAWCGGGAFAQDELNELNAPNELSELESLSRNADDPFAGVIEDVNREPVSVTLRALDKITARTIDIEIAMNEIARFGSLELQPRYCDRRPPEEFPETTVFLEVFDVEFGSRGDDLKIDPSLLEEEGAQSPVTIESVDELDVVDIPVFGGEEEEEESAPVEAATLSVDPIPARPSDEVVNGPQAEGENIFRGWMFASTPALNALEHPVYDVWVIDCKTRAADS